MKPLGRLVSSLAAGAALVALLSPVPATASDVIDEEVASFKTYLGTKPPSDGLKNKIAEIAQKKDPRVADVLLPLLSPKYDEEVRVAVCQNIGKQGSTKVLPTLLALVEPTAQDLAERAFVVLGWRPVCPCGGTYTVQIGRAHV